MKNNILLLLFLFPLFGINNQNPLILEIDKYIKSVENNTNLSEFITEYILKNNEDKIIGGEDIYAVKDSDNNSLRIRVEHFSVKHFEYYFYYRDNQLVYVQYEEYGDKELHTLKLDTLNFGEYYFHNEKLLKGISIKGELNTEENLINKSNYYFSKIE